MTSTRRRLRTKKNSSSSNLQNIAYAGAPSVTRCRFLSMAPLLLLLLLGLFAASAAVDAYRIGDTVDAAVSTRSARPVDLLMADHPRFGITRAVRLPGLPDSRFSLSFEEGLFTLPYVDASSVGRLIVTFVYSPSGPGRIHSVTSRAVPIVPGKSPRFPSSRREVEVLFEWVEEAEVDPEAGTIAVLAVVFVVSILFLIQLCALDYDDDDDDDNNGGGGRRDDRHDSYYKGQ